MIKMNDISTASCDTAICTQARAKISQGRLHPSKDGSRNCTEKLARSASSITRGSIWFPSAKTQGIGMFLCPSVGRLHDAVKAVRIGRRRCDLVDVRGDGSKGEFHGLDSQQFGYPRPIRCVAVETYD